MRLWLRLHITKRVPPARPLAASGKPARAVVNWGANGEPSKGREPVIGEDAPVRNPRTLYDMCLQAGL